MTTKRHKTATERCLTTTTRHRTARKTLKATAKALKMAVGLLAPEVYIYFRYPKVCIRKLNMVLFTSFGILQYTHQQTRYTCHSAKMEKYQV